jgi:hydrogenase maturation protein HypF
VLKLPFPESNYAIVALGSDLKQCAAVSAGKQIHITESVSDLSNVEDYATAEQHVRALLDETGVEPDIVACDAHPDAMALQLAEEIADEFGSDVLRVQHHHAHIASVMAEHNLDRAVVGLALDGFGYGADGTPWGGECLLVNPATCQRLGRLKPLRLPGGDQAARQPWRMAASALSSNSDTKRIIEHLFDGLPVSSVLKLCRSPATRSSSSAGRYFDAASALILGITENSFEAEAAIKLEQLAADYEDEGCFSYRIEKRAELLELDLGEAFSELVNMKLNGDAGGMLARRFHNTLIAGLADLATEVTGRVDVSDIALSGGCFFNRLLMQGLKERLSGFQIYHNEKISPGDGNISAGQAWAALQHLKEGR